MEKQISNDMTEVLTLYHESKISCSGWHENIKRWRRYYDFEHYTKKPLPGEERFSDPTFTNVVDLAVGILLANEVEWKVSSWNPSLVNQKMASRIEKMISGVIDIAGEREEDHLYYSSFLHFVRDGAAVIYTTWDTTLAEEYKGRFPIPDQQMMDVVEYEGYSKPPIRVEIIDPLKLFMLPGGPHRWLYMFRTEEMSVYNVEKLFGVTIDRFNYMTMQQKMQSMNDLVDIWRYVEKEEPIVETVETIDPETGQIIVEEMDTGETQKIKMFQNGLMYAGIPIWDMEDMPGIKSFPYTVGFFKPVDRNDSTKWGHNIMAPMETSVLKLEKAVNRRDRQITRYTGLPLQIKTMQGRKVMVDAAFGNTIEMAPDESLEFPKWWGNPPDVDRHIEYLRSRVQQSGFADVMFGAGMGEGTGYALSQLSDQNRIRLAQPRVHLEMFWSRVGRKIVELATTYAEGEVMRVYGVRKGKDFMEQIIMENMEDFLIKAKIKPEFPNDKTRNHAMATQVRGQLPDTYIMEKYLDVDQPDDLMDLRMQEQAMQHPKMIQYSIMSTMKELADSGDEAAKVILQEMQMEVQAKQAQAQTAQKAPNPEQPMGGMPSSTGEPTQQEQGAQPPGQGVLDTLRKLMGSRPTMSGEE